MSASPTDPRVAVRVSTRAPVKALDWQSAVEQRGAACDARGRLADALRALALDIGGYDDDLSPADRAWLREAIRGPVEHAVTAALETLNSELAGSLHRAPARLRPQIAAAGRVTRIDFE